MRPVRFPRLVATLATVALVVVACRRGAGVDVVSPVPALNATHAPLLPTDATELPSFDPGRFQQLLSQLKGTPVVVNVWGAWCAPCRSEAPLLQQASQRYGRRVQFLGVDILDSRSSSRSYTRRYGLAYPSVFDESAAIRDALGFLGQPDTVFYDADGNVTMKWAGQLTPSVLRHGLARILPPG
jgi:cytochrome c biogenesis protein CcmG, thiol:disulfide interchange protein DsbE